MGSFYVTEMANWLRAAGLDVREQDGWQSRGRSTGGYDGDRPWVIMWHDTAGPGNDGENDAYYCSYVDSDRPITNLVIGNTGIVWVCAAGATNTNGKGYAQTFSRGTVPDDSMNTYAIGIELSNNGIGEPFPQVQIDACFTASLTLCRHLGLQPDDVCTHQHWAPDRKIDCSTAAAVQGTWRPSSINSSGSWSVDDLRAECRRRASSPTPLPPTPPEDEVTEDDINKIVARVKKELPPAVWAFELTPAEKTVEAKPARYWLQRAAMQTRQYLGGWNNKAEDEQPSPTMLQDIHNKVSTLLKRS